MWCYESCFFLVRLEHRDLVVIGERVYKIEHPLSGSRVHYLIYPRKWEAALWTSVIQVNVIDTDLPFSSFLRDNHYVCQPIWVFNFLDEFDCQQLVYFSLDDFLPIWMKALDLLANGF